MIGFVGKVILEKSLRALPQLRRIYILIRQKKGSSLIERFKREVLGSQCFDRVRKQPNYAELISKVVPVEGDMLKENLGMSESTLNEIIENVHVLQVI